MLTTLHNYSLRHHNSFGLDVKAATFVEYDSVADLQSVARKGGVGPFLHIGGGNNLLFTQDYDGVVLHSAIRGISEIARTKRTVRLRVGAAEVWDDLVAWSIAHGAYGLENLSLIPSEVGAAAVQNIGAYGAEAKDFIHSVEVVDMTTGETLEIANANCDFAYRYSNFKGAWRGRFVITHVIFELSTRFVPNLSYRALAAAVGGDASERREQTALTPQQLRDVVINIRRSKLPEPSELGNAGSFFMNPVIPVEHFADLQGDYPAIPSYPAVNGVKVPAAWLIEQSGWKGRNLGATGVYEHQPLVLVNRGGATGADILRLAEAVIADVKAKFGITLRPEVLVI